jgi:hypothetical protein
MYCSMSVVETGGIAPELTSRSRDLNKYGGGVNNFLNMTSRSRDVNKYGGGVNNFLNMTSRSRDVNKYGGR